MSSAYMKRHKQIPNYPSKLLRGMDQLQQHRKALTRLWRPFIRAVNIKTSLWNILYLRVLFSIGAIEETQVKQLAMTLVTPPNIPDRKLARQSHDGSIDSLRTKIMQTILPRTPPMDGRYMGSFLPNISLHPPMKQSVSRLGSCAASVVILIH